MNWWGNQLLFLLKPLKTVSHLAWWAVDSILTLLHFTARIDELIHSFLLLLSVIPAVASSPNVTSVTVFGTSISLMWLPPVFPNGFLLSYRLMITSNTSGNVETQNVTVPASVLSFTFTDLEPITEYTIQIQAVNNFGGGEYALVVAQTGG